MPDDRPEPITWALLIGKWTAIARASVALPDTPHGHAWRAAVPSVIALQGVTMALMETAQRRREGQIDSAEVAVARDRAGVMIAQHAGLLRGIWTSEAMPTGVLELINDAEDQLRAV